MNAVLGSRNIKTEFLPLILIGISGIEGFLFEISPSYFLHFTAPAFHSFIWVRQDHPEVWLQPQKGNLLPGNPCSDPSTSQIKLPIPVVFLLLEEVWQQLCNTTWMASKTSCANWTSLLVKAWGDCTWHGVPEALLNFPWTGQRGLCTGLAHTCYHRICRGEKEQKGKWGSADNQGWWRGEETMWRCLKRNSSFRYISQIIYRVPLSGSYFLDNTLLCASE